MDVAIIDYNMSNLYSVQSACNKIGLSSVVTSDKDQILNADSAILPGVGAFGEAMTHIKKSGLDKIILDFIETGKPFIGICLGLQLLFNSSDEFGSNQGLEIIRGQVKKFDYNNEGSKKYPIPQVGWNRITEVDESWKSSLLCNSKSGDFMYFVHSYYVEPIEKSVILASTDYGGKQYCSAIKKENIFATQFHPEKSGIVGLKIYEELKKYLMKA